ncbi:MAG: hypothetical protein ACHQNE_03955 [Candidatus Kapaibacterium sp.]
MQVKPFWADCSADGVFPCLQLGMLKSYNVHTCGHKNCLKLITPAEEVTASFGRRGG